MAQAPGRGNVDDDAAQFAGEVAIAYDLEADTAREFGRGDAARNYAGVGEHEIAGTFAADHLARCGERP